VHIFQGEGGSTDRSRGRMRGVGECLCYIMKLCLEWYQRYG
jgi:hypothetical protein